MDSLDKSKALLDRGEQWLLSSSAQGANPMQVLMAGALPMVRSSLGDLVDGNGSLDTALALIISVAAQLRSDGAPPLIVGPGGAGDPWLSYGAAPGPDLAGALLAIGEPVSLPDLPLGP